MTEFSSKNEKILKKLKKILQIDLKCVIIYKS